MKLPSLIGHTHELLGIVVSSGKPADGLIDTFFRARRYLGSHDRRFIAESSYGTLRHWRTVEFRVDTVLRETGIAVDENDKRLLVLAAYLQSLRQEPCGPDDLAPHVKGQQLRDRLPEVTAALAIEPRFPAQDRVGDLGLRYSFPDWMVRRFLEGTPDQEIESLLATLNLPAPITLRVNTLKISREDLQAKLAAQGIETVATQRSPIGLNVTKRFNVFSLKTFQEGAFEVQDEGSQLLPRMVDPKPTAKLLDACAGAGGKTLAFASLMKNRGEIFATDTNGRRLEELKKRSRRAGASNIRIYEVGSLLDLEADFASAFDVVFVDAPCSGLGTLRRNPGMKWSVTEQTVSELSEKQSGILDASALLVKPGGRLVYATCTLVRSENEEVVERFLGAHAAFRPLEPRWSPPDGPSVRSGPYVKLMPHLHGTDGFFCAIMERIKP